MIRQFIKIWLIRRNKTLNKSKEKTSAAQNETASPGMTHAPCNRNF
jgi:hypothetical protein